MAATELVLQRDLNPLTRLTASVYDYRLNNQYYHVGATGAEVYDGRSKSHGVELQLDRNFTNGMSLRTSASWQDARDPEGRALVNSPKVLAKFNLSWLSWEGRLRTALEAQYLSARLTQEVRSDAYVILQPGRTLPSVALLNATLSTAKTWHGLGASLSVKNLLDRRYEVPTSPVRHSVPGAVLDAMPMDGRTVWLQLRYDYGI